MMDIRHVVAAVLLLVKGICELLGGARDFGSIEEGVHRLVEEAGQKVFVCALEELDEKLLRQRDRANLKVVRFCKRTWVSTFGCITMKRRLYIDRRTGRYRFLLDEALGWEQGKRLTVRMEALALEWSLAGFGILAVSRRCTWAGMAPRGQDKGRSRSKASITLTRSTCTSA